MAQVATIWAPKMDPKSIPKASQDEAKTTKKNEANKNRFRIGLGCEKGGEGKSRRVSYKTGGGGKGRPKKFLKSNFFGLEHHLNYCLVLGAILVDVGHPAPLKDKDGGPRFGFEKCSSR